VDDHQTHNARFLSERGGAMLIPQAGLTAERLAEVLTRLDRERLLVMARAARAAGKPDATRAVAEACMRLAA
jgi:UDP-N-acetylglucosamine--N-acetylmuramyl-(pentapeptide) pyrophosphoryl-undecaprenol N-acetylglucosamine transferase